MTNSPPYPGTPRWVTVSGAVIGILVTLIAILALIGLAGPHGAAGHASSGPGGNHAGVGLLIIIGLSAVTIIALNASGFVDGLPIGRGWSLALTPRVRKLVLIAHVSASAGSLGAVAVFLLLAVTGLTSQDPLVVRAVYIANELIAWYVILPLILAALLIGLIQSLGTPWGLLRHYWILAKLLLTVLTVYILLQQMDGISHMARVAADTIVTDTDLIGLRRSMRLHAAGGLAVLLLLIGISVFKPRGMTRYGWRRQMDQ
jgi:hypothetical protein